VVRIRRAKGLVPLIRFYEVELTPPDADQPWRPGKPVSALALKRRLFAEGFYQRDVADLLLEADERRNHADSEQWVEHSGVRPTPPR